jgi:hypothetical protein
MIKTITAVQPSLYDVHNFGLNNYLHRTKKTFAHSEKHNGNKGYPIKKFDYYVAGASHQSFDLFPNQSLACLYI